MTEPASIRIRVDGPYVASGLPVRQVAAEPDADGRTEWVDLPVLKRDGKPALAVLCRCGRSAEKPFCDGSHRGVFDGTETAAAADPVAAETDAGPAAIEVIDAGPLVITGSVALEFSDGRLARTAPGVALCRCGLSATKPYCDGSHAGIGEPVS